MMSHNIHMYMLCGFSRAWICMWVVRREDVGNDFPQYSHEYTVEPRYKEVRYNKTLL